MPQTQSLPSADRYISRRVRYRGREMGLCSVFLGPDGHAVVEPFLFETPATVVLDRDIEVSDGTASSIEDLITLL